MTRVLGVTLIAIVCWIAASPRLEAYLKLGTQSGTQLISLHWTTFPVRYFITNRDIPNVSAAQLRDAVGRAFASWDAIPNTGLSSQFVGFTSASPLDDDSINVLGFLNRPDLDRVLGSTSFTFDVISGQIIEADIFFNSSFAWSVAQDGTSGAFDLESIAAHEIGHLHGLGHSALGETELRAGGRRVLGAEALMFPIAFSPGSTNFRTPRADDIAGISDIYGNDTFRRSTGSITGRVTKNGSGVMGAHIVAFNPTTGKLVGGFSLSNDGTFVIAGLDPGRYIVRAEPLDDADLDSFFPPSVNVDVNFTAAYYERLVIVPRGGTAPSVAVKVVPK